MGARSKPACMMVGYVHNSTTLWRIWDPEFKTVKSQSEVIFDEERNAYSSCAQEKEDMFGLKSKESTVECFEDQPEADEIRDPAGQPMADDIATSGTGDAIRGRTDGTTSTSGTGDVIRGRTDETPSGTDSRVSSSGHTIGGSRHAETVPMVLRTNRGRTEGGSGSESSGVQGGRHGRGGEHGLRQQTYIQRKAV